MKVNCCHFQDGGCTCPGDVAKAFGAGADFVMLGGMLAGHTESGGDIIEKNGKKFKLFYGMSSATAMEKHSGGVAEYRFVRINDHNEMFVKCRPDICIELCKNQNSMPKL